MLYLFTYRDIHDIAKSIGRHHDIYRHIAKPYFECLKYVLKTTNKDYNALCLFAAVLHSQLHSLQLGYIASYIVWLTNE